MPIYFFLSCGVIVGVLARVMMPGRESSWTMSILIGVVGALLGGFLGADGKIGGLVMSLLGAVLGSVAYRMFAAPASA